jgi:hypothetical protein
LEGTVKKAIDANGIEITVGCTVKHRHEPVAPNDPGPPERCHHFFGESKVEEILPLSGHVVVRPTFKWHIGVHLPQNLMVVS